MKLLISLLFLVCMGASAQEPLKIVVTSGPGSGTDTAARFLTEPLSAQIDYRQGAGGMVGLTSVAKTSPEQQILVLNSVTMIIQSLSPQATFDIKQFAPISAMRVPFVLLVSPKLNIKNLNDLQQYKASRPLSYGSFGVGTVTHVLGEQLSKNTKLNMTHVPFKAGPEIIQALVGGHIDMAFMLYPGVKTLMQDKKVIPLTIDMPQRHKDWPNLPTFTEFQLSQVANISYVLLVSNQVTDRSKITALQKTVVNAFLDQTLVDKFEKNEYVVDKNQLVLPSDFLVKEQQRISKIIKDLNLN